MLTNRALGFTLIESVIVLTIIGILLMVGMPSFTVWQSNSQVRLVTDSLQNDIRQAQAEAVRRNRQVALVLTNDMPTKDSPAFTGTALNARNWAIVSLPLPLSGEGPNDQPKDTAGNDIPGDPLTGIILTHTQNINSATTLSGTAAALCFNSSGRLVEGTAIFNAGNLPCGALPTTAAPQVFDITNARADRPLRLEIRLGGQIRMCDPKKPAASASSIDGCENPLP